MAVLPIVTLGHPVLRSKARPVVKVTKRVQKLIRDMAETMYQAKGVGLAAPQVNVGERIIVVDVGQGLVALINPEIIKAEGAIRDVEGCLSIPGRSGYVTRAAKVIAKGLDAEGRPIKVEAQGYFARAIQHEIDHLDGILFIDRLEEEVERE
ncbi:MAG: peptide deformylase [Firmicutes bacterium]|nr:peptide deformylase [Bacillota bacterium]